MTLALDGPLQLGNLTTQVCCVVTLLTALFICLRITLLLSDVPRDDLLAVLHILSDLNNITHWLGPCGRRWVP